MMQDIVEECILDIVVAAEFASMSLLAINIAPDITMSIVILILYRLSLAYLELVTIVVGITKAPVNPTGILELSMLKDSNSS